MKIGIFQKETEKKTKRKEIRYRKAGADAWNKHVIESTWKADSVLDELWFLKVIYISGSHIEYIWMLLLELNACLHYEKYYMCCGLYLETFRMELVCWWPSTGDVLVLVNLNSFSKWSLVVSKPWKPSEKQFMKNFWWNFSIFRWCCLLCPLWMFVLSWYQRASLHAS